MVWVARQTVAALCNELVSLSFLQREGSGLGLLLQGHHAYLYTHTHIGFSESPARKDHGGKNVGISLVVAADLRFLYPALPFTRTLRTNVERLKLMFMSLLCCSHPSLPRRDYELKTTCDIPYVSPQFEIIFATTCSKLRTIAPVTPF